MLETLFILGFGYGFVSVTPPPGGGGANCDMVESVECYMADVAGFQQERAALMASLRDLDPDHADLLDALDAAAPAYIAALCAYEAATDAAYYAEPPGSPSDAERALFEAECLADEWDTHNDAMRYVVERALDDDDH